MFEFEKICHLLSFYRVSQAKPIKITVFPRHTSVVVVLIEPSTNSTRGILSPGLRGRLESGLKSRDINGLGCVLQ